ncbi:SdpI family protein [Desulfovirgula thermocuniculi]|uniref:SdpI family protein n=1 Tax=Desulfovirgula thermocuniculi TaxID=348842 RepID=UPI0003FEE118|nr:SdpI family protein [Desulfovirgula thermocuniculi]
MSGKRDLQPVTPGSEWPALALLLAMFVAGAAAYAHLPEMVPAHWNLKGEVDNYFSRFGGAFALPLLAAGIYLAMLLLPFADPRRESYRRFAGAYRAVRMGLLVFLAALHGLILAVGLGGPADLVPRIVPLLTGALFVVIGNYLPQVRPNYFFGIRTPWTLADEEVWRRTHRFSGPVFVLAGLAVMAASLLPSPAGFTVTMVALGAAVLSTVVYSYLLFRRW